MTLSGYENPQEGIDDILSVNGSVVDVPPEATLKLLINSKLNRRCRLGNVQFTFPNLHANAIFIYFDVSETSPGIQYTSYSILKFIAMENDDIAKENARLQLRGVELSTSSLRVSSARHLHFYLFPRGSPFSAPVKFKEPLLSSRAKEKARSTVTGARLSDPIRDYDIDRIRSRK